MKEISPAYDPSSQPLISRRSVLKTLAVGGAGLLLSPQTLLSACRSGKD
ncbi:MAG TPA: twin-arginine translocation signal domain-containing protein, partial [Flavisolibacter sp.]|nr:twin-arginine translocation signal domain-containing protein [Flavisolibacter sp.]